MRNTVIAAVAVCALLSACSSPTPEPQPSTSASAEKPVSGIPSPDAEETGQLLDALALVDPALDHERSISRARDTCQQILAGGDEAKVLSSARQRFDGGSASVSDADAAVIVQTIKDSDWCKP